MSRGLEAARSRVSDGFSPGKVIGHTKAVIRHGIRPAEQKGGTVTPAGGVAYLDEYARPVTKQSTHLQNAGHLASEATRARS